MAVLPYSPITPKSPDFTPVNYFLWGANKGILCDTLLNFELDLVTRISFGALRSMRRHVSAKMFGNPCRASIILPFKAPNFEHPLWCLQVTHCTLLLCIKTFYNALCIVTLLCFYVFISWAWCFRLCLPVWFWFLTIVWTCPWFGTFSDGTAYGKSISLCSERLCFLWPHL